MNAEAAMTGAMELPCPECTGTLSLKISRFGPFYGCRNYPRCTATHGAHPDGKPLGKPADKETKLARMAAHAAFDKLWVGADQLPCYTPEDQKARRRICRAARGRAYRWLMTQLSMTVDECHIGLFDQPTCARVIEVCAGMDAQQVRAWHKDTESSADTP